jgi:hypothetical protein
LTSVLSRTGDPAFVPADPRPAGDTSLRGTPPPARRAARRKWSGRYRVPSRAPGPGRLGQAGPRGRRPPPPRPAPAPLTAAPPIPRAGPLTPALRPRRPTAPARRAPTAGRPPEGPGHPRRPPATPTMVQMEANLETVIRISIRPAPSSTQSRRQRAREEGSRAARTHRSPRADPEPPRTHAPSLLSRRCRRRHRHRRRRRSSTPGLEPPPRLPAARPPPAPPQRRAQPLPPGPRLPAKPLAVHPAQRAGEAGSAAALMPGLAGGCATRGPAHPDTASPPWSASPRFAPRPPRRRGAGQGRAPSGAERGEGGRHFPPAAGSWRLRTADA